MQQQEKPEIIQPLDDALNRMIELLFRPFSLKNYFLFGILLSLANCSMPNYNTNVGNQNFGGAGNSFGSGIIQIHPTVFVGIGLILFVFVLLACWIGSRIEFSLIDSLSRGEPSFSRGWGEYSSQGNGMFVLRGTLLFFLFLFLAIPTILAQSTIDAAMLEAMESDPSRILPMLAPVIALGCCSGILLIGLLTFEAFLRTYVTPVIYIRNIGVREGLSEGWALFNRHLGTGILYFLFRFVLNILAGLAMCVVAIPILCLGICVVIIPILGPLIFAAVLFILLCPITMVVRLHSLYFIQQFGPEYMLFSIERDLGGSGGQPGGFSSEVYSQPGMPDQYRPPSGFPEEPQIQPPQAPQSPPAPPPVGPATPSFEPPEPQGSMPSAPPPPMPDAPFEVGPPPLPDEAPQNDVPPELPPELPPQEDDQPPR